MVNMICYNCKGNGYVKLSFEAETSIDSVRFVTHKGKSMKINTTTKSWTEGTNDSISIYYGPPLDPECFQKLQNFGRVNQL